MERGVFEAGREPGDERLAVGDPFNAEGWGKRERVKEAGVFEPQMDGECPVGFGTERGGGVSGGGTHALCENGISGGENPAERAGSGGGAAISGEEKSGGEMGVPIGGDNFGVLEQLLLPWGQSQTILGP